MSRLDRYLDREEEFFGQIAEVPYASPLWYCTLRTEGESLDGVVPDSAAWAADDTNGGDPWAMLSEFMECFGAPLRDTPWDIWSLAMRAVAENPPEAIFEEGTGFILHRDVIEYLFERDEDCNQSVIDRAIDRATGAA